MEDEIKHAPLVVGKISDDSLIPIIDADNGKLVTITLGDLRTQLLTTDDANGVPENEKEKARQAYWRRQNKFQKIEEVTELTKEWIGRVVFLSSAIDEDLHLGKIIGYDNATHTVMVELSDSGHQMGFMYSYIQGVQKG